LIRPAAAALVVALVVGSAAPADAAIQTPLPQFLPQAAPAPVPITPAPLPPPINPGYAATPPNGLSPLLTQPGPVYQLPQPANPAYPPLQLPGPIDQQKLEAYRNALRAQQWEGLSPGSERSRDIQQQLNAPDPQ
jgi:hypothetical protein